MQFGSIEKQPNTCSWLLGRACTFPDCFSYVPFSLFAHTAWILHNLSAEQSIHITRAHPKLCICATDVGTLSAGTCSVGSPNI